MIATLWVFPAFAAFAAGFILWIITLGSEISLLVKTQGRKLPEASRLGYALLAQIVFLVGLFLCLATNSPEAAMVFFGCEIATSVFAYFRLEKLRVRLGIRKAGRTS